MNSQMWYELQAANVATNQNIKHVVFTANKQIKSNQLVGRWKISRVTLIFRIKHQWPIRPDKSIWIGNIAPDKLVFYDFTIRNVAQTVNWNVIPTEINNSKCLDVKNIWIFLFAVNN